MTRTEDEWREERDRLLRLNADLGKEAQMLRAIVFLRHSCPKCGYEFPCVEIVR